MANLLTHRMRRLKRRVKQKLHDLRTFTHPAVKIAIVVVLIALTVAAVVYALRSAPANEQPADPGISQPQAAATYLVEMPGSALHV
jgi:zona occludens toxin (predicted ATPase)